MGGSAWELKIDGKRLQDKENNYLEERIDVPEPQGAQNSNSGRVEAAILDTFIVLEPPEGPLGTLHFDPPGISTKRHARVLAQFLSKT